MENKFLHYLTPIFRVILFVFFIFLCSVPFGMVMQFDFINLPKDAISSEIILESSMVIAVLGGLLMFFKAVPAIDFNSVFINKRGGITGFLMGSLFGMGLIAICAGLLYLMGNVEFSAGSITPMILISQLIYFVLVGIFEEFMFRTLPLYAFAERYPVFIAILLNSLLFGAVHMLNPSFTWLAMLNISLAGALFSIFTLQKRNVSWAIGIHFTWNFAQGILLGYKVSGTDNPGILSAKPLGNAYLSGGAFGIEGSIICTLIMVITITYLLFKYKIAPIYENVIIEELEEETTT
jgi:membrane protease YdiL (CAAX protease family)